MPKASSCSWAKTTNGSNLYPPEFHQGFFRLAVGLEDTDDLIRDIDHALS